MTSLTWLASWCWCWLLLRSSARTLFSMWLLNVAQLCFFLPWWPCGSQSFYMSGLPKETPMPYSGLDLGLVQFHIYVCCDLLIKVGNRASLDFLKIYLGKYIYLIYKYFLYIIHITYIITYTCIYLYICMYAYMYRHYSLLHWRSLKNNLPQKLKGSYIYATKCQFR